MTDREKEIQGIFERKIDQIKAETAQLREVCELYREALEYYANHESVIKEAYHSNEKKQITCVHTFINHRAKEALAQAQKVLGPKKEKDE